MECLCHEWCRCDDVTLSKHKHLRYFILAIKKCVLGVKSKVKCCTIYLTQKKYYKQTS